ncbi:MAG: helix-turn-helix domain-containing protein [Bacteroidales bacterium]|nr:helix-turn-helix domain-containing protein [Bacteroidales bacterium]
MNCRQTFLLCVALCMTLLQAVQGAAQTFTNIRSTQTMTVRAIVQTQDKAIWFASGKTLYRFDGTEITPISSAILDEAGAIACLCEAEDGTILVGCERGLVEVDGETYKCVAIDALKGQHISAILLDGKREWIGSDKGLLLDRRLVAPGIQVVALALQQHDVLLSSMQGLKLFKTETSHLQNLSTSEYPLTTCFTQKKDGSILVGAVHEVYAYNGKMQRITPDSLSLPVVKCMTYDARGRLLIGCDGGLYEMDDEVRLIEHDARNPRSFAGNTVWCMTTDHCGNIWIGSDNGLSVMTSSQSFCIYPLSSITADGKGNQIYSLLKDTKGRIWLGGTNGIVSITDFGRPTQQHIWYEMNSTQHPLPHNRIRIFYEDPIWGIWAGTDGGLLHYDETTANWTLHPIDGDAHNWVYDVRRESDALLVTTFDAVYRIKPDSTASHIEQLQKVDAKPVLDARYGSTHIGDAQWTLTPNGLSITKEAAASGDEGEMYHHDLPERFVSIYYQSDENLLYLGGSDQFAIIKPDAFLHRQSEIWFSPEARFVIPAEESTLSRGMLIAMCCTLLALVVVVILYILQRRKIKQERIRREAMLKSAHEKMHELEHDNNTLQQQLRLQQLTSLPSDEEDDTLGREDKFLLQVNRIIEQNLDTPDLSVTTLSEAMNMSSKQLYRKIKQCTDLTAVEYIRKQRLQRAALLLTNQKFTINEVMYMVGFSNPSYFSRSFAAEFDMTPTEYRMKKEHGMG